MKKLIFIFAILTILITYFSFNLTGLIENANTDNLSVGVYASGSETSKVFDNCFAHGFVNEIFGITPEIFYSYSQDGEVLGEFFVTDLDNFNLNKFSSDFGLIVTHTNFVENVKNIYAKSALLPYKLEGKEFNVQIAISNNKVTVASPIIMGSY